MIYIAVNGVQPIWADDYTTAIAKSKIGVNLTYKQQNTIVVIDFHN